MISDNKEIKSERDFFKHIGETIFDIYSFHPFLEGVIHDFEVIYKKRILCAGSVSINDLPDNSKFENVFMIILFIEISYL